MSKTTTNKKSVLSSGISQQPKKTIDNNSQPGEYIIKNILNYSKALNISKSKTMGSFELVLN
jgi:hypothetical protein